MYQHALKDTNVVRSFALALPAGSTDVYYKDYIGNVSTSNFRAGGSKGALLYGGWKYDFFYGFNVPSNRFLKTDGVDYELKINLFDSLKNVSYNSVSFQVQLPEGARFNISANYTVSPRSIINGMQR
jgi:oligosaccharyltransferase complex subunit alpha (ribophorin I)